MPPALLERWVSSLPKLLWQLGSDPPLTACCAPPCPLSGAKCSPDDADAAPDAAPDATPDAAFSAAPPAFFCARLLTLALEALPLP